MNFVIVGARGRDIAICRSVFGEVYEGKVENARYISANMDIGVLGRAIYHFAAKEWVPMPVKSLVERPWEVNYGTIAPLLRGDMENCVIFCPGTHVLERVPRSLVRALRRKSPDCHIVYYLVDSVDRTAYINKCAPEKIVAYLKQFDVVYTYDERDAAAYGYRRQETPIWSAEDRRGGAIEYDLYFCGRDKDRASLLNDICRLLAPRGVTGKYVVTSKVPGAYMNEWMCAVDWRPYPEIVEEIKKCRCVVELLGGTNTGSTLRYKEALIYNKKLLTNDRNVSRMPYYDPRWMRYFEKADDIDVEWLMDDAPVDYGYRDDFSVRSFLDRIESDLAGDARR